jgi:hypothetical protein
MKMVYCNSNSKVEDLIYENENKMIGKKELFGIPASDKPTTVVGFDLFRIANGKIVEMWQLFGPGTW